MKLITEFNKNSFRNTLTEQRPSSTLTKKLISDRTGFVRTGPPKSIIDVTK